MTQFDEAITRYHRLLETDSFKDLGWAEALHEQMRANHLNGNSRVSPVLRPHFITQRQYTNLVKAAEALHCAIDRVERLALNTPALMARIDLLPAEKMLASLDPGYSHFSVTSLLDTHLNNGTVRFVGYGADSPAGVVYGEMLNNLFYDAAPVKEFRKKQPLAKLAGANGLVHSLAQAYKDFGGKRQPRIAILEFRQPFGGADMNENALMAEMFRRQGYQTAVVSPDHLEYRNGVLRNGNFEIDLIYRRIRVSEFLMRFDLNHPLVRAYRERAVCVVNNFRSEMAQKKAIFDLLTDDAVTAGFPAAERKAIRDYIPWTRVVNSNHTTHGEEKIDLPAYIAAHRETLVLKPNEDGGERPVFVGADMDDAGWEKSLKTALRGGYVVQEVGKPLKCTFPMHIWGSMEMRDMYIDVHPHAFLGKVNGCSSWLTPANGGGFSTVAGLAPTFILESR